MSSAAPFFFKEPIRYLRWASINKPAYFYSVCVGLAGPGIVAVVVPTRKYLGYERIAKVPQTYPSTRTSSMASGHVLIGCSTEGAKTATKWIRGRVNCEREKEIGLGL